MYVRELVEKNGLGIWVSCGKPGYPPFQVMKKTGKVKGFEEFACRCSDGKIFILSDCLNDYEVIIDQTLQTR